MSIRALAALALALVFASAALLAGSGCNTVLGVGDVHGHAADDAAPSIDAPADASTACPTGATACASGCVDLAKAATDCGACGHDCGGGACSGGACQPFAVADDTDHLDAPTALAVTASAVFWIEKTRVRSCPLPQGCVLQPTVIADAYNKMTAIAATAASIFFTGCRACDDHFDLYQCPASGCPEPAPIARKVLTTLAHVVIGPTHTYVMDDGNTLFGCETASCAATVKAWGYAKLGAEISTLVVDGDTLYVRTVDGALHSCPEAAGCDNPTTLTSASIVHPPFAIHRGRAYWFAGNDATGLIASCDVVSCDDKTFAVVSFGGSELQVDDTGVYWLNAGKQQLRHCPLTGCPAGGVTALGDGLSAPHGLVLADGFAYWLEGNRVMRVRKP